jgi:methylthioribose-1-phosphate isomerase
VTTRAVEWREGKVRFLDQTKLPADESYVETGDYRVIAEAIIRLRIRGAPAIGIAAAMGVALAARASQASSPSSLDSAVAEAIDVLGSTRPTAVNLPHALRRLRARHDHARAAKADPVPELLDEALAIEREESEASGRIAAFGMTLLQPGSTVLTHCNTGALATAGIGTALGIITAGARQGLVKRVYATETRPLLQGARLTTWELLRAGIDTVLITDGTAATVMARGEVHAVLVGADRIAANGDTANKVGTHMLAVLARRFGVPFSVAAPVSTIDPATASGEGIPVEERDPSEVTHCGGIRIAAEGVRVFAPAFDVTPADLIAAIVTDRGIARPPCVESLAALLRAPAGPAGERR